VVDVSVTVHFMPHTRYQMNSIYIETEVNVRNLEELKRMLINRTEIKPQVNVNNMQIRPQ
jgi:hypothetical protein